MSGLKKSAPERFWDHVTQATATILALVMVGFLVLIVVAIPGVGIVFGAVALIALAVALYAHIRTRIDVRTGKARR